MKHYKLPLLAVFVFALFVTSGCWKKSSEQASNTGFETLSTTEELAQLPQSTTSSSSNQQTGIEVLPVETSPITQGVAVGASDLSAQAATASQAVSQATSSASRSIQIQTALKNAGFYSGNLDGKIGPASKRAIEAFQKSNNLKVDGKVGPKTWAAMQQYLTSDASSALATETPAASN